MLRAENVTWIDFELLWIFLIASTIVDEVSTDEKDADDEGDPGDDIDDERPQLDAEDDVEELGGCGEDKIGLLWIIKIAKNCEDHFEEVRAGRFRYIPEGKSCIQAHTKHVDPSTTH